MGLSTEVFVVAAGRDEGRVGPTGEMLHHCPRRSSLDGAAPPLQLDRHRTNCRARPTKRPSLEGAALSAPEGIGGAYLTLTTSSPAPTARRPPSQLCRQRTNCRQAHHATKA